MSNPYYKQHWIDVEPERHAAYETLLGFHPAMKPLLAPLDLRPGLTVLDVGSGPGQTTMELARRVGPEGRITAIDINPEFIERARARAREQKLESRIAFVAGGFPPLPFNDASFDRVWCKNVLEYVDSAAETVAEMARVARPGGIVVASDSDWEMMVLEVGPEAQARSDRIVAAAKAVALKEPRIGRRLYGLFREAGLREVKVKAFSGADQTGRSTPMQRASLANYAADSGQISRDEIQQWLADIELAVERGRYLFILPQFVVRGVKA